MGLLQAVAGPHVGVYTPGANATRGGDTNLPLGIQADDGYALLWLIHKQRLGNDGTDQYGNSLLENVYRGMDWRLRHTAREYGMAGVIPLVLPYGKSTGGNAALQPIMTQVGVTDGNSGLAGVLVLTCVSGTSAFTAGPQSLTAGQAIHADGQQGQWLLTSKERQTPVLLDLLPYTTTIGGNPRNLWYVTT